MPGKMRARHDVFGVKDVLDNEFHRNNGWTKVADDTPLTVDEQRRVVNEARMGSLSDRPAAEVAAVVESLPEAEKASVAAAEKAGKARKTVLDAAE